MQNAVALRIRTTVEREETITWSLFKVGATSEANKAK